MVNQSSEPMTRIYIGVIYNYQLYNIIFEEISMDIQAIFFSVFHDPLEEIIKNYKNYVLFSDYKNVFSSTPMK